MFFRIFKTILIFSLKFKDIEIVLEIVLENFALFYWNSVCLILCTKLQLKFKLYLSSNSRG